MIFEEPCNNTIQSFFLRNRLFVTLFCSCVECLFCRSSVSLFRAFLCEALLLGSSFVRKKRINVA